MPLMDLHGYPLWEKGVHDVVLANFVSMQRIFAHYTKGAHTPHPNPNPNPNPDPSPNPNEGCLHLPLHHSNPDPN